jgi:hypothetical protein
MLDRYRLRPGFWLQCTRLAIWVVVHLGDDYTLRYRRVISSAASGSKSKEIHGDVEYYGFERTPRQSVLLISNNVRAQVRFWYRFAGRSYALYSIVSSVRSVN